MQRISILAQLRGESARPAGTPPETRPRSTSVAVDAADAGIGAITSENHVVFTSDGTFDETGTATYGGEDAVDFETVGEGTLRPAGEDGLLHGAVVWRVTQGRGRFAGASGLITSNFVLDPGTGTFDEWQSAVLWVP
jgi:hypothetical protein